MQFRLPQLLLTSSVASECELDVYDLSADYILDGKVLRIIRANLPISRNRDPHADRPSSVIDSFVTPVQVSINLWAKVIADFECLI